MKLHYWERIRGWHRLAYITDDFGDIDIRISTPFGYEDEDEEF